MSSVCSPRGSVARLVPGSVERAEAQDDALGPRRPGDRLLEVADGGERRAERRGRIGVERVLLGLDGPVDAGVGPAGVALGDDAPDAHRAARGQQVVGARRAQAVRHREVAVEVARVHSAGERGRHVDDGLGLLGGDRGRDGLGVEGVRHDRPPAEAADEVGRLAPADHADDVVPSRDELRQQLPPHRAGGSCDEDLHEGAPWSLMPPRRDGAAGCDTWPSPVTSPTSSGTIRF